MRNIIIAISLLVPAGCATAPEGKHATVMEGMSRNNLRFYFGEPSRIETTASGGETWYYRFSSWNAQPSSNSGTTVDPVTGQRTDYASANLNFSKNVVECPVHISADGFVVRPVPEGKVVRN
jgi:hypothetical protein